MRPIHMILLLACVITIPTSASAQSASPVTAGARAQFRAVKDFIVRAAENVPEDLYAFRATPEVRTLGQLNLVPLSSEGAKPSP